MTAGDLTPIIEHIEKIRESLIQSLAALVRAVAKQRNVNALQLRGDFDTEMQRLIDVSENPDQLDFMRKALLQVIDDRNRQ